MMVHVCDSDCARVLNYWMLWISLYMYIHRVVAYEPHYQRTWGHLLWYLSQDTAYDFSCTGTYVQNLPLKWGGHIQNYPWTNEGTPSMLSQEKGCLGLHTKSNMFTIIGLFVPRSLLTHPLPIRTGVGYYWTVIYAQGCPHIIELSHLDCIIISTLGLLLPASLVQSEWHTAQLGMDLWKCVWYMSIVTSDKLLNVSFRWWYMYLLQVSPDPSPNEDHGKCLCWEQRRWVQPGLRCALP